MPRTHAPIQTADRFRALYADRAVPSHEAHAAGFTRDQLRAAVRRGLLSSPQRGVLMAAPDQATAARNGARAYEAWRAAHVARVRARLALLGPTAVATHESAAAVWGLPIISVPGPEVVTVIKPGEADFAAPGLAVRNGELPAHVVKRRDGLLVTDIRRTAVDLARGRPVPQALIPLDAAARRLIARASGTNGAALRESVHETQWREIARRELDDAVITCRGWPGVIAVRDALRRVEPASESPFESRSRGWFLENGIRSLEIGAQLRVGGTTYWVDFCDRARRVVGEADGWEKYGDTEAEVREALRAERARQDRLAADGWAIVRWSGADSRHDVVRRMQSALARLPHR